MIFLECGESCGFEVGCRNIMCRCCVYRCCELFGDDGLWLEEYVREGKGYLFDFSYFFFLVLLLLLMFLYSFMWIIFIWG